MNPPRCFSRKRMLLFVLALLMWGVGGAIINVAVAWGCALWLEPDSKWTFQEETAAVAVQEDHQTWTVLVSRQAGITKVISVHTRLPIIPLIVTPIHPRTILPAWAPPSLDNRSRNFEACGWPTLSMAGGYEYEYLGVGWNEYRPLAAFELSSRQRQFSLGSFPNVVLIPLRPLWPGFAINTIFYAAVLWMLFTVPGAVRRLRGGVRIKRGQCAACGYSLRESVSEKCPECGCSTPSPAKRERGGVRAR